MKWLHVRRAAILNHLISEGITNEVCTCCFGSLRGGEVAAEVLGGLVVGVALDGSPEENSMHYSKGLY